MGYIKGFISGVLLGFVIGTSLNDPRVHRSFDRLSDATRRKMRPIGNAVQENVEHLADHAVDSAVGTVNRAGSAAVETEGRPEFP